jgi:hypothetical protein
VEQLNQEETQCQFWTKLAEEQFAQAKEIVVAESTSLVNMDQVICYLLDSSNVIKLISSMNIL